MGALSPYSSIFSDVQNELRDLTSKGQLQTNEEKRNFIQSKGLNLKDFIEAQKEYFTIKKQGGKQGLETPGFAVGRIASGALGKVGEGIERVGETFAPKTTDYLKDVAEKYIPESVERARQEFFFPTQTGPIEKAATEIGSYIVPATGAIKAINMGSKFLGLANKAGKVGKAGKIAAGWTAGTTLVEDPEQNILNDVAEFTAKDEQGRPVGTVAELVNKIKVDPNDTKSAQYLQASLNNLLFEGSIIGVGALALKGLTKLPVQKFAQKIAGIADEYIIPTAVKDASKVIGKKRKEWFSSRFGTDDDGLGLMTFRRGGLRSAMTRASILERQLRKQVKANKNLNHKDPKDLEKLNEALAGDKTIIENIREYAPEVADTLQQMRNNIDNMSLFIKDNIALGKTAKIRKKETVAQLAKRLDIDKEDLLELNPNLTNASIKSGSIKEVILPSLKTSIDKNLKTYINRTYQMFDNPEYAKKLQSKFKLYKQGKLDSDKSKMAEDIRNTRDYFKSLKDTNKNPIADEDIDKIMSYFIEGVTRPEYNAFLKGLKPRTSKILKTRKEVPQEVRALWGEVKDPFRNYANSFTKMANVISEYNFLDEIATLAIAKNKAIRGNITAKVGDDFVKAIPDIEDDIALVKAGATALGGTTTGIKNPLKGLFIDPSWKKAIDDGMEVALGDQALLRHWMKAKATSQSAKTVFSIPTHGRNVMGNLFIMLANGTVNPYYMAKGFKTGLVKRFTGTLSDKELKQIARYQELGVIDSSVQASSLRAAAGDAFKKNHGGFVESIIDKTTPGRLGKKGVEKTVQLYEAEDNLFKIANFENLKKSYRKAFPDMSEDALEKFTAQRTRDMMPNYNLVPKALKSLRAMPIGNFLAFPAEIARNSINLAKYAWKDISGATARELRDQIRKLNETLPRDQKIPMPTINENALRVMGMKRLAGMTAAAVAGDAMVEQSKQMFGITDEQEEALNNVIPEWEKGTNKIFTGPIKRNKDGEIVVNYLNLGPIDPYAYIKNPTKMIIASILNNEDYNEQTIEDMRAKAMWDLASPFADPSMVLQNALDAYRGKGATPDETAGASIYRAVSKSFTPGTVDYFRKRILASQQEKKFGEGETPNQYGFTIGPGEVDNLALFGLRRQSVNLSEGFKFNTSKPLGDMKRSKGRFTNVIRDYRTTNPQDVVDAYKESQQNKLKHAQRLRTILQAYEKLGMDEGDMYQALTKSGILSDAGFNDLMLINENIFMPDNLSEDAMILGELETKVPIPYQEIYDLYNAFSGGRID